MMGMVLYDVSRRSRGGEQFSFLQIGAAPEREAVAPQRLIGGGGKRKSSIDRRDACGCCSLLVGCSHGRSHCLH